MPNVLTDSLIIRNLGTALVQFVWLGAIVGLVTAAMLGLLHRRTAAIRYLVATGGLLTMFLVPVASTIDNAHRLSADSLSVASTTASPTPSAAQPQTGRPPFMSVVRQSLDSWVPTTVLVWFAGVVTLSTRLLAGWLIAVRLRRHGTRQVSDEWRRRVQTLSRRLRVSRPVRVLESVVIQVPAVVGWLRPVLLLPTSALAGLTPTQLEAVIAHELAHIRRHDYLVNGLQTAVETLLFYHPAVWWVSMRVRQEREHCCDDVAIALCGDPVAYGRALADLDTLRPADGALVVAASGGSLAARIRRLVGDPTPPPRPTLAWLVLGGVAAALALTVVAGSSVAADESPEPTLVGAVTRPGQVPEATVSRRATVEPPTTELQFPYRLGAEDFCCPEYLGTMIELIRQRWNNQQPVAGEVTMKFTVQRDGLITDVDLESMSGNLELDQSAERAVRLTDRLPPLPGELADDTLVVHLNFQYQTSGASGLSGTARARSTVGGQAGREQEPVRVGGDVPPPQKVYNIDPVYSEAAKQARVSGVVVLDILIDVDGLVRDVELLRSVPQLDQAAITAVQQWEYTPTVIDDVAVPVVMTVTVNFRLAADDTEAETTPQGSEPSPAVPPATFQSQEPVRVGGDIPVPQKVRNIDPVYPDAAKEARVSGVVILEAVIGVDGTITDVQVLRSVPQLDEAAIAAVRQWEYTPTVVDDLRVPVVMTVTVNFKLAADDAEAEAQNESPDTDPT